MKGARNMQNYTLSNNIVVLTMHIFLSLVYFGILSYDSRSLFQVPESFRFGVASMTWVGICLVMYVACGYFLKPVEKYPFLSVMSITVILTVAFLFSATSSNASAVYLFLNPSATFLSVVPFLGFSIFVSPIFPSLLVYFGMVLRMMRH
jgi:hypothetical protein